MTNISPRSFCTNRQQLKIILSSFFIALALYLFAGSAAASDDVRLETWATPIKLESSDNFFKVSDELYRSAQPSKAAMKEYEEYGIKTIITLRRWHGDEELIQGTDLKLVEIPLAAWSAGKEKHAVKVLKAIREAEKPVLIHCQHGADRTGMSVAMYRIVEQGWSKEDALNEMVYGGFGFHSIWGNIPKFIKSANIESIKSKLDH